MIILRIIEEHHGALHRLLQVQAFKGQFQITGNLTRDNGGSLPLPELLLPPWPRTENIQGFSGTLFSRRDVLGRSRSGKAIFLAGPERGPLNEGSFVLDRQLRDFFLRLVLASNQRPTMHRSKNPIRSDGEIRAAPQRMLGRRLPFLCSSYSRLRILSTLPRLSRSRPLSCIRINTYS